MGRVVVVGSINMDVVVRVERHPRGGETVPGEQLTFAQGGKGANQAVAAARAGATVEMIGAVGADSFASTLLQALEADGIGTGSVARLNSAPTGVAVITVDGAGENTIVYAAGANNSVSLPGTGLQPGVGDVVVSQFEVESDVALAAFRAARAAGARTVFNAAPARPWLPALLAEVDVLVVNEWELASAAGATNVDVTDADAVARAARAVRSCDRQVVVVTLGGAGHVVVEGDDVKRERAHSVPVVDTTGAGDCFIGWLCAGLADGADVAAAARRAAVAASLSVQRPGAGPSMPHAAEVDAAQLGSD